MKEINVLATPKIYVPNITCFTVLPLEILPIKNGEATAQTIQYAQKKIVQFCGKNVVRNASVHVDKPIKFCIMFPKALKPVSMIYTGCPPKINT